MIINDNEYLKSRSYPIFLFNKIRRGDLWKYVLSVYKGVRKYTLISGIIRAIAITVALLEKSAVLLLIFTCIILVLPVVLLSFSIYVSVCIIKHFSMRKSIKKWLVTKQNVTVFITRESIFSASNDKLFLRCAKLMASEYSAPVIVVCSDRFINAKWYSLNLLAVRTEYFFFLKRNFIEKKHLNSTFIVL